jgi:hypothetical protein
MDPGMRMIDEELLGKQEENEYECFMNQDSFIKVIENEEVAITAEPLITRDAEGENPEWEIIPSE